MQNHHTLFHHIVCTFPPFLILTAGCFSVILELTGFIFAKFICTFQSFLQKGSLAMEVIGLQELRQTEFSVTKVIPLFQYWEDGDVFNTIASPKMNHSLLYFAGCDGSYTFPDGATRTVSRGDIVYIPSGACYTVTFFNKQEKISTILINFQLSAADSPFALADTVTVMAKDTKKVFHKLFYQTAVEFSSSIALKSGLYQIFHELQKAGVSDLKLQSKFAKIAKGISYLENDSEQLLSIEQIAEQCDVSCNTFRRLFSAYAGVSPVEFRLNQKILRAKQLLESEVFTVSEVSDTLNFSDVSYFSRIFKKKTGQSPLEYLNAYKGSDSQL